MTRQERSQQGFLGPRRGLGNKRRNCRRNRGADGGANQGSLDSEDRRGGGGGQGGERRRQDLVGFQFQRVTAFGEGPEASGTRSTGRREWNLDGGFGPPIPTTQ